LALGEKASRIPAGLYIGHCLGGLSAAVYAARVQKAVAGFDLEDFHETETEAVEQDSRKRGMTRRLLRRLLPECRHVTAASPAIARRCTQAYGAKPEVILNVYPRSEAPAVFEIPPVPDARHPARLYWFSQTIGPGRGLEEALAVLALMRLPVELHLRGFVDSGYREFLLRLARESGMKNEPYFHPPEKPDRMPALCSGFHLGLSLEKRSPENRDLCLTNKIFAYLLAGVPVWLSATSAQRELAGELGSAALVADPADAARTAAQLDAWLADRQVWVESSRQARNLAETRFCWEVEQKRWLDGLRQKTPLCAS
jgi:glycosyltransferase involved in cell wall biosynthesis